MEAQVEIPKITKAHGGWASSIVMTSANPPSDLPVIRKGRHTAKYDYTNKYVSNYRRVKISIVLYTVTCLEFRKLLYRKDAV